MSLENPKWGDEIVLAMSGEYQTLSEIFNKLYSSSVPTSEQAYEFEKNSTYVKELIYKHKSK